MGPVRRIYLDTNIFIAAYEWRDEIGAQLFDLLGTERSGKPKFVSSELTLSELLVAPYKNKDDDLIQTYDGIILTSDWLEVPSVSRRILRYGALLRAAYTGLKLPDAIHLSTAIGSNCSHILTGDHGIKGIYSLPQSFATDANDVAPLTVIRPDIPTLTSLLKSLAS